jgi:nicotinamidase-related amidase
VAPGERETRAFFVSVERCLFHSFLSALCRFFLACFLQTPRLVLDSPDASPSLTLQKTAPQNQTTNRHKNAKTQNKKRKKKAPDEIVLPKTSSSPFASTTLEYVLRNLGRDQLLVCGALTDQCISSTVREAADRGLRVTLCPDACVGSSDEAHAAAVSHLKGYARIRTTEEAVKELLASGGGGDEG